MTHYSAGTLKIIKKAQTQTCSLSLCRPTTSCFQLSKYISFINTEVYCSKELRLEKSNTHYSLPLLLRSSTSPSAVLIHLLQGKWSTSVASDLSFTCTSRQCQSRFGKPGRASSRKRTRSSVPIFSLGFTKKVQLYLGKKRKLENLHIRVTADLDLFFRFKTLPNQEADTGHL